MSIRKSNIYTRGGDKGETSLIGGRRVPKYHLRIESYGSVDELMAQTAMLRDLIENREAGEWESGRVGEWENRLEDMRNELLQILGVLMTSATMLASEGDNVPDNLPGIKESDVVFLENSIDRMDAGLEPLQSFVLPGGSVEVSQAHICRTVCRRTERKILELAKSEAVEEIILQYFNRLSDYYFLLSRSLASILGFKQLPWKP